jgi:hypothetical protein
MDCPELTMAVTGRSQIVTMPAGWLPNLVKGLAAWPYQSVSQVTVRAWLAVRHLHRPACRTLVPSWGAHRIHGTLY